MSHLLSRRRLIKHGFQIMLVTVSVRYLQRTDAAHRLSSPRPYGAGAYGSRTYGQVSSPDYRVNLPLIAT